MPSIKQTIRAMTSTADTMAKTGPTTSGATDKHVDILRLSRQVSHVDRKAGEDLQVAAGLYQGAIDELGQGTPDESRVFYKWTACTMKIMQAAGRLDTWNYIYTVNGL